MPDTFEPEPLDLPPPLALGEPDLVPIDHWPETAGLCGAEKPRSPHWGTVRHAFALEHPCCEACGGRKMIQIHHRRPFHLHPELELDPKNLITLCEDPARLCHLRVGHSWNFSAYNPHVEEDAARELDRLNHRLTA